MKPPMHYYEAWFIGMSMIKYCDAYGLPCNEGINCMELIKEMQNIINEQR